MDVLWFLKERTAFLRRFYDLASEPFNEVKRKISAGEPPYDDPPFDDSGEPPYLSVRLIRFGGRFSYAA
jgi:hypothetical protein